jgi:hypothetical protein
VKTIAALLLLALAGCMSTPTLPIDYRAMSAEQLKALSSDRNAIASCSLIRGPWGSGVVTYIMLDKAAVIAGSITIGSDCVATITADPKQAAR